MISKFEMLSVVRSLKIVIFDGLQWQRIKRIKEERTHKLSSTSRLYFKKNNQHQQKLQGTNRDCLYHLRRHARPTRDLDLEQVIISNNHYMHT